MLSTIITNLTVRRNSRNSLELKDKITYRTCRKTWRTWRWGDQGYQALGRQPRCQLWGAEGKWPMSQTGLDTRKATFLFFFLVHKLRVKIWAIFYRIDCFKTRNYEPEKLHLHVVARPCYWQAFPGVERAGSGGLLFEGRHVPPVFGDSTSKVPSLNRRPLGQIRWHQVCSSSSISIFQS